jgi:predicted transcriptional regulator
MTRPIDLDVFIPLFLIKRVESFRDSYSLARVLAWKFDIIDIFAKKIVEQGLMTETVKDGISHYEITNKGLEYVELNTIEGKKILLDKYPEEREFINSLFE